MGVTRYLADKSALARLHLPAVREELEPLMTRALVGICGVTELEMLYSARNIQERARMKEQLEASLDQVDTPSRRGAYAAAFSAAATATNQLQFRRSRLSLKRRAAYPVTAMTGLALQSGCSSGGHDLDAARHPGGGGRYPAARPYPAPVVASPPGTASAGREDPGQARPSIARASASGSGGGGSVAGWGAANAWIM
jgi:predicted nucleic acid-binding protein